MISKIKSKVNLARKFAKKKHLGQIKQDSITNVYDHLDSVVKKLKSIGVTDENVLSAAWLHDVLESTNATFVELESLFGNKVAQTVFYLTKDNTLPKNIREKKYQKQLKISTLNTKLIKLCDIASNRRISMTQRFRVKKRSRK